MRFTVSAAPRRLMAALVAVALAACAPPASSPTPTGVSALAGPFGPQAVQRAIDMLAGAGISVRVRPTEGPVSAVTNPSRVELLRFQARNLALEASVGGGTIGSELDAYATAAGSQPLSPLIAGWMRTAGTEAARTAAGLVPGFDQVDTQDLVIPGLVAVMFLADMVGPATTAAASVAGGVAAAGGFVAANGDFCDQVAEYLSGVLEGVLDPELDLDPRWLADAIELYSTIEPDPEHLRRAVGAMALLAYATSISRPWVTSLSALPNAVHYIIAGDELTAPGKSLHLSVVPGEEEFAEEANECAALAETEMPSETEPTQVIWLLGALERHVVDVEGDLELEERGQTASAALEYQTKGETADTHRNGTLRTEVVAVTAAVVREEIVQLEGVVRDLLTGGQLGVTGSAVAAEYARLAPMLRELLFPRASAIIEVTWHEDPDPTPEPTPDATPDESPDEEPEPVPGRRPCRIGCGSSNGDPHIVTVDGVGYDFQAAGEFTLLRASDGSFELQVRQEPYEGSQIVSINTALALGVGGRRAGIYLNPDDDSLDVLIDGIEVDVAAGVDLGGASVSPNGLGLEILLDEGTRIFASSDGGYGINLVVDSSEAVASSGAGVMGVVPDGSIGVPTLPDGTAIPPAADDNAYYDAVYIRFADAWRITPESSLFDYTGGATTDTYRIENYPVPENVITLEDLTPEQRAAGEAACTGIPIDFLREQCIFDVAITGDMGFAAAYDLTANLVERGTLSPSEQPTRVVNLYADEAGPVSLDAYSWSTEDDAAFITEVPHGQASDYFDPAVMDGPFGPSTRLSMQRHGLPLNEWAFNVVDENARTIAPGLVTTFVVWSGDPEAFTITGDYEARFSVLHEEDPTGFGVPPAPEGQGLIWIDTSGIQYTHPEVTFYVRAGDACLTHRDYPTLAQPTGTFRGGVPFAIPVGSHELSFHGSPEEFDPAFQCDTPQIHGPVPINVAAGDRFYLFVYAAPGEGQMKTLVVPIR